MKGRKGLRGRMAAALVLLARVQHGLQPHQRRRRHIVDGGAALPHGGRGAVCVCVDVCMCVCVCVAAEARSYLSLMVAAEHAAPLLLRLLLSPLSLLA